MLKKKTKILFGLLPFWLMMLSLQAQTPVEKYYDSDLQPHQIDREQYGKAVAEIDYEKYRNEKKTKEKVKEEQRQQLDFEESFGPIFKFFLIAIAIGLLVFLLIKLMDAESIFSPKNRKIKGDATAINIENIEENLHESDLAGFIRQALTDGNFALAIRLYYLAILKELSLTKQIKWKKDKTNREYLREMSGQPLAKDFREATLIFERVWYGTGTIAERDFTAIEPKLKALLQKVEQPILRNAN